MFITVGSLILNRSKGLIDLLREGVIKSESQLARKGEAMMHKTSKTIHKDAP
jgi:hypothetical protein